MQTKDCSDGYECLNNEDGSSNLPHCKLIMNEVDGEIVNRCYDSERVMYISTPFNTELLQNPDSFFKSNESHLNRCENDLYDGQSFKSNANRNAI